MSILVYGGDTEGRTNGKDDFIACIRNQLDRISTEQKDEWILMIAKLLSEAGFYYVFMWGKENYIYADKDTD